MFNLFTSHIFLYVYDLCFYESLPAELRVCDLINKNDMNGLRGDKTDSFAIVFKMERIRNIQCF